VATVSATLGAAADASPRRVAGRQDVHPAWLPDEAFRWLGARRVAVRGSGPVADTVRAELERACARNGGALLAASASRSFGPDSAADSGPSVDVLFAVADCLEQRLGAEGFVIRRESGGTLAVRAGGPAGLLYGMFHLVRLGAAAFAEGAFAATAAEPEVHRPAMAQRMLDHWDNVAVHEVMGQVERGYAGGSVFWKDGGPRGDLDRVRRYARLLAASGINAVGVNNVNVHALETRLLTDRLGDVAELADVFRAYGIRVHLSVNFAAPVALGALDTADPLDPRVRAWWARAAEQVYASIPDFGGFVVKADSEGQPGPFAYGRSHADGANMLAEALAPHGGTVHWRAFVYDHHQDWRDRRTDRARAAHDHFAPLDGQFADNVVLQVKHGPMDFQTREPVSPVIGAMPATRLAVELQVTQEYTGQQKHICYLAPMWSEVLGFRHHGAQGATVAETAARGGGLAAVSNVGDDPFWTGHPLAQANLYAFGRLAWDPQADPAALLDEWAGLTFGCLAAEAGGDPEPLREVLHRLMDGSWRTYERYTAPLGVGFMVRPGDHYGPDVDGYEYTPWGTYHFADRDGIGVDRTRATGTGFTGQYPPPWSEVYESLADCPDELLLFFHHVPYGHVLRSGTTVVQHIYDTHFAGAEEAERMRETWAAAAGLPGLTPAVHARVAERLDEQVRCAREWRDQINTYFHRKSGVPDAHGRRIY